VLGARCTFCVNTYTRDNSSLEPIKVEPPVENLHSLKDEETHPMDFIGEIKDDLF
jgi:hypothetical protein